LNEVEEIVEKVLGKVLAMRFITQLLNELVISRHVRSTTYR
jgi:hypothetical protein